MLYNKARKKMSFSITKWHRSAIICGHVSQVFARETLSKYLEIQNIHKCNTFIAKLKKKSVFSHLYLGVFAQKNHHLYDIIKYGSGKEHFPFDTFGLKFVIDPQFCCKMPYTKFHPSLCFGVANKYTQTSCWSNWVKIWFYKFVIKTYTKFDLSSSLCFRVMHTHTHTLRERERDVQTYF